MHPQKKELIDTLQSAVDNHNACMEKKSAKEILQLMKELEENSKDFTDCWLQLKRLMWQQYVAEANRPVFATHSVDDILSGRVFEDEA